MKDIKSTRGLKLSPSLLMIYEINHIWTAEMKRKWRNDRRSERNLCNCIKKPEKKFRTSTGFEPVTSRYRCDALPAELWSHWRWEQVNCGFIISLTLISFTGTYEPTIDLLIIIITIIMLTIEEDYSLDRHSETHAKVVMKLFEAASWFCWTREEAILTPGLL